MSATPVLAVEGLSVRAGNQVLLRDVSFSLQPGEALVVLGGSGAGKSLLAQAVMGNLPVGLTASGWVTIAGERSRADDARARRASWGRTITLLPQEPAQALSPLMRLLPQLREVYRHVLNQPAHAGQEQALSDLHRAGLAASTQKYPWQLSGGMAQRAVATISRAGGARVLIADEPSKGLDAKWRNQAAADLKDQQKLGRCIVVITHDLRMASALGGQLLVLRASEVVEQGNVDGILTDPKSAYVRELIEADPHRWPKHPESTPGASLLTATGLTKGFGAKPLFENVGLNLHANEKVVVQGPSGTGKSTFGNVLLGLIPPDEGQVTRMKELAPTALQKIYQDPVASFAPSISLLQSLGDAARLHHRDVSAVRHQIDQLGLPQDLLERKPGEVSGGELQRISLARALIPRPSILFADEPTSRLDPISQRKTFELLLDAVDQSNCALLLITHDDDIARAVGGRLITMESSADDDGNSNRRQKQFAQL